MKCLSCGNAIKNKAVEGADYIKVKSAYWCKPCAVDKLSQWDLFELYEKLAEEGSRYRTALVDTLKWSISEGYCVRPREQCRASPERCLGCWLNYLVGEK